MTESIDKIILIIKNRHS